MNTLRQIAGTLLVVGLVLVSSCAPQAAAPAPAPVPEVSAPAPLPTTAAVPVAPAKPAWQQEWDKTLAAAKKEGKVIIYTSGGSAARATLMEIAQAQGIKAEVVNMRTEEFLTRATAERRAGLYLNDVWLGGLPPAMVRKEDRPAGFLEPLAGAFILPELTETELIKKLWFKGELPWANLDHTILVMTLTARTPIVINTNLVKEGEIKSWRDVLSPKWKGNVILGDPTVAGSGQLAICAIDAIMGWDYVKELAKMEPLVMRDQRQQMEWLAHGKAAIVVGPQPEQVTAFLKLGLPIRGIVPVEGSWVSPGSSALSWIAKAPDQNASKVFINGLLSKEGQTAFGMVTGFQSTRLDVTTVYLRPEDSRTEGAKYINAYGEEFTNRRLVTDKLAKDLFGPIVMR